MQLKTNSDYIGEETGSVWGTKVKYLSEAERAKYKISIKDGQLYDSLGELFDTKSASSVFSDGKGKAISVKNGVVKEITRRSGHYLPEEKHLNQFVHKLKSSGIDTGSVKISSGF